MPILLIVAVLLLVGVLLGRVSIVNAVVILLLAALVVWLIAPAL